MLCPALAGLFSSIFSHALIWAPETTTTKSHRQPLPDGRRAENLLHRSGNRHGRQPAPRRAEPELKPRTNRRHDEPHTPCTLQGAEAPRNGRTERHRQNGGNPRQRRNRPGHEARDEQRNRTIRTGRQFLKHQKH